MKTQIICLGGGGFSKWGVYSDEDLLLEKYILEQTGKPFPSICFLPTASADDAKYTVDFYTEFAKLPCRPSHLSLFAPQTRDLESFLLEKDCLYIGGGNTKNMLALWREWGIDKILHKALQKGIVLSGISAGMNCWYEECVTDSLFGDLTALKCLGFLKGSACPHYNGEEKRRPSYHALMQTGKIGPGIAIDDNALVHYVDGEIIAMLTTKATSAYRLSMTDGHVKETKLSSRKL